MKFIVGKTSKGQYISVDSNTAKKELVSSPNGVVFNERKYAEYMKKYPNSSIFTILAEIIYSDNIRDVIGYMVSNSRGEVKLYASDEIEKYASKMNFLNYAWVNKEGSKYIRRNPNISVETLTDEQVKGILGYNFDSFNLKNKMTLKDIEICMAGNGFILGYTESFKTKTYSSEPVNAFYSIYYNREGHQIILSGVESSELREREAGIYDFNWWGQKFVMMSHIDSDKYYNYLKKNPYSMGSTSPVDGPETDILIQEKTSMQSFISTSKNAYIYSKPCIPYYVSKRLDSSLYMLHLTPRQNKWCREEEEKRKKKGKETNAFGLLVHYLMGFDNIKKYEAGLRNLYQNYILTDTDILNVLYSVKGNVLAPIDRREAVRIWNEIRSANL